MSSEAARIPKSIRFGKEFELDLRAYELRRSGKPLKLERIPMDLLVLLVEYSGELVTRDQIIEHIWGKDVFLDTDNSINAAVRKIRQVLKDDPDRPRFVVTVTGKGYRFIAQVEEASPPVHPPAVTSPEPKPADHLLGKKISHYRVTQMLGGGGMGVVYKAEDLKLGRAVALKFLPGELAADPIAFERLQREARAASSLDHPNICSIYQLGEHEGQPFIVMQFLEGETLREWIEGASDKRAAQPISILTDLAIQIADGLDAAHQKGIIHRDIKPTNIFITVGGRAKILDFGVAKFVETKLPEAQSPSEALAADAATAHSFNLQLTHTGASVGTPSYLSPEQIRREKIDPRSDLFSFGLVLYEMATRQRAFSGKTATEIRDAVLSLPAIPPRQVNPEIPLSLEAIIRKGLEKDPARRYQSAADMRRALERLRDGSHPLTSRRWPILAAIAATVIASAIGLAASGRLRQLFRHEVPGKQAAALVKNRPSVAVFGFKNLSPNGQSGWLSTALPEMLTSELAAGSQLRTIPEENVANFKSQFSLGEAEAFSKETLERIHTTLGSDMVVLGSYVVVNEKARDQIRVYVRVQQAGAGETVASLTETGSAANLLELVSHAGERLRTSLGVARVTPEEQVSLQAAMPSSPEAARLYAEGIARMRVFDALGAHDLLQRAVDADPLNAIAHSALAESWVALGYQTRAAAEAKKAFDLSSNLSHADRLTVEARYYDAINDRDNAIKTYGTLSDLFPDDLEYGLRLANAQHLSGKWKEALSTIDVLRKLPSPLRDDPRLDLAEANSALRLPEFPRALAATERAVQKAGADGTPLVLAHALKIQGDVLNDSGGDDKRALAVMEEARSLYQAAGDRGAVASILNNIGLIHYRRGNLADAHHLYEESIARCRAIGHVSCAAYALYNDAVLRYDQGNFEDALRLYREALLAHETAGNRNQTPVILNSIANVFADKGDQSHAKKMYQRSIAACRAINDQMNAAVAVGNLASLLADEGNLAAARARYQEALELKRSLGRPGSTAYTISSLGDVSLAQGDLAEARKLHQEALFMRTQIGQVSPAAEDRLALGWVSLEEKNFAEAEADARTSQQEFEKEKRADNEAAAHTLLARILLEQQKLEDAEREISAAEHLSAKSDNRIIRLTVAVNAARLQAALGNSGLALKTIESAVTQAKQAGLAGLQLEARLASAEIRVHSNPRSARIALSALQRDAQKSGFGLIARKAASLAHQPSS